MTKRTLIFFTLLINPILSQASVTEFSFNNAIQTAYKNNPIIGSQQAQTQIAQGQLIQSTLLPNPTVSAEFENIGGSGAYNNFSSTESTLFLKQPIVLGERLKAQGKAYYKYTVMQKAQLEVTKSNLYRKVGTAYVNLLYGQRWVNVAQKLVDLNESVVNSIKIRINAGASSKVDLNLAQITLGEAKITLSRAKRKKAALQRKLENLVNKKFTNTLLVSDNQVPHFLSSWQTIANLANNSNILKAQRTLVAANKSKIVAEQKKAWPNLDTGIGFRHFAATDDTALIASVSIKLPINDYNQGSVKSSQSAYTQSLFDLQQTALELNTKLRSYYLEGLQNKEESEIVANKLLPTAKVAVQQAQKGYSAGRYSYLELANAMRILLSEEKHYIESHTKLDKAVINIRGLTLNTFKDHYDKEKH